MTIALMRIGCQAIQSMGHLLSRLRRFFSELHRRIFATALTTPPSINRCEQNRGHHVTNTSTRRREDGTGAGWGHVGRLRPRGASVWPRHTGRHGVHRRRGRIDAGRRHRYFSAHRDTEIAPYLKWQHLVTRRPVDDDFLQRPDFSAEVVTMAQDGRPLLEYV